MMKTPEIFTPLVTLYVPTKEMCGMTFNELNDKIRYTPFRIFKHTLANYSKSGAGSLPMFSGSVIKL
jgi:hypothetical protein